ncbi:Pectate lyase superfamily protein [Roseovarius litorisediminis]|uniref:Pectate lyase superfamily protein n=1 Tax=Roseovarius litorisediminis TaxID=1312363 RepID=A0A1Y5T0G1_9RHOB|nr:glycosyl hydrolase family 28-related protein [Roseovarius litorisediminis]SLN53132.1 Pectate lyase superfamily protein [Roseovarius litorisediminis]
MNKAITDGVVFTPPAFANGLDVWSSGDGTPGSDTYENALNAGLVPADQDFGGALELQKTDAIQKLRYMGETPILPGCFLQIRARVKAISGNLPNVRISAWAGGAGSQHVVGLTETANQVTLTNYGEVVEVTAIVGTSQRTGVDMVWGGGVLYGHFGLDLTGPSGGVVRIDDIEIEDVSGAFLRDLVSTVDVRDYGAVGDGVTDSFPAFEAADAAANGREILVPAGVYFLGDSTTIQSRIRFEGTVVMPDDKILALTKNYDLPAYIDAFGEEELAFKKAFQALVNNAGHDSLDLGGRQVGLRAPVDMQAAVANKTSYAQRRIIRNGQIGVFPGPNWDTEVFTSQASYDPNEAKRLTGVLNVANIPIGSLIEGAGVGREVYVRDKNVSTQEITLSQPLYDAAGTQVFTFRRFKYMLDFSGFDKLSKFGMSNIEFQCGGHCSGILLPPSGVGFSLQDCFVTKPKNRGISSHGEGDQGMMIDRCQFLSDESPVLATERTSIALNANANDIKIRNNRVVHFLHFAVISGTSSIILGNHVFQGDSGPIGPRTAGFIMTRTNNRATITGNYICDCSVEWGNEHDQAPGFSSEFSFSALSITGNVFLSQSTAPWFRFLVVKPHGTGHFINGLTVTGNTFRLIDGVIDRIEGIDTSFADMDYTRFRNITFGDNAFNNVETPTVNPLVLNHTEASPSATWVVDPAPKLPFGAWAQAVESVVPAGPVQTVGGAAHFGSPYYEAAQGPAKDRINLKWGTPVQGTVTLKVRIDLPL